MRIDALPPGESAMNEILTPDICVIGAGSGGLSVAAAAAAFGVSVVLIEKGKVGGDCLNYGCGPSNAFLASAKHASELPPAAPLGMNLTRAAVDLVQRNDRIKV